MRNLVAFLLCVFSFGCAGLQAQDIVVEECRNGSCLNRLLPMREVNVYQTVVQVSPSDLPVSSLPVEQPTVTVANCNQPTCYQADNSSRFVGRGKHWNRPLRRMVRRCR